VRLADVPPKEGHLLGIDVSVFQGPIDWAAMAPNVRFAFIRATSGRLTDRRFDANASNCRIPWGAYHALAYGSDPVEQAQHFTAVVNGRGELPPVLDFEVCRPGEKASEAVRRAETCMTEIEQRLGRRVILYTYPAFFQRLIDLGADVSRLADRPLWIAHYGRALAAPKVPTCWSTWHIWQWYGGGHARLDSGVDVDVNWWRGTEAELSAFACYGE
jgi:lysozyme